MSVKRHTGTTIQSLRDKGMAIEAQDEARVAAILRFKSYYRLKAYWEEFLEEGAASSGHERYKKGTAFDDGVRLYEFDRALRFLVFDAVERIEVAFRACWEKRLSAGAIPEPYAYLEGDLYQEQEGAEQVMGLVKKFYKDYMRLWSNDLSPGRAKWAKETQEGSGMPVVWVAAEVLSFGHLKGCVARLKLRHLREIASSFGLSPAVFMELCSHLHFVRNICAHHEPLWNRRFAKRHPLPPVEPLNLPADLAASITVGQHPHGLHDTLLVLYHLVSIIEPGMEKSWCNQLLALLDDHRSFKPACLQLPDNCEWIPQCMGFPQNWRTLPPWAQGAQRPS